jgi:hypothetical protein
LIIGLAVSTLFQTVASAQGEARSKPVYWIIEYEGPDNDCVQGYVDLRVNLGPDNRVVDAAVIASHPPQEFDNVALERIRDHKISDVIIDESRELVVRIQFRISVHQMKRCTDAANAS